MNEHDKTIRNVMARVLDAMPAERDRVRTERLAAAKFVGKLMELPPALRRRKIKRSYFRLRTRAVVEKILERCRWIEAQGKLDEAEDLGELAWYAQSFLPAEASQRDGRGGMNDLRSMISAEQGNIARRRCKWEAAQQFFDRSWTFLDHGIGDVDCRSRLCHLHGLLLRDRGLLDEALRLLNEAARTYQQLGSQNSRAKVLLAIALIHWQKNELRTALDIHLTGLNNLDPRSDARTLAAAHSNAALLATALGRHEEAASFLRLGEPAFESCSPTSTVHLKRTWVLGIVAQGQGHFSEAETHYQEVLAGFRCRCDPYNEALVSLDLATLYAEQNRFEDLAAIAEETYDGLRSQELEPEAEKALKLFVDAARRREAAIEIIRTAAETLRTHPGICAKCP